MNRRSIVGISATVLGLALLSGPIAAQQKSLKEQLVGAWTLASVYDQGQDGKKNEPWGPDVKGSLMFSPTGRFSLFIVSANRDKSTSNNPRTPVGQVVGYFGTYTVDETAKTYTYHIERATFPQWDGTNRTATVESIAASDMSVISAVVPDPALGPIIPHQAWKRTAM
jgi:hypothetical protein